MKRKAVIGRINQLYSQFKRDETLSQEDLDFIYSLENKLYEIMRKHRLKFYTIKHKIAQIYRKYASLDEIKVKRERYLNESKILKERANKFKADDLRAIFLHGDAIEKEMLADNVVTSHNGYRDEVAPLKEQLDSVCKQIILEFNLPVETISILQFLTLQSAVKGYKMVV